MTPVPIVHISNALYNNEFSANLFINLAKTFQTLSKAQPKAMDVHFYYFPASYYSQRARIALEEKKIPHKTTYLNFLTYEQLEPWYLRINPLGQVPVLQVGEKIHNESETLVNIIDTLDSPVKFKLVPDEATPIGQSVAKWRKKLDAIEIEEITYGVMITKCAGVGIKPGLQRLADIISNREKYNAKINHTIEQLEDRKKHNPDLADTIDKIIERQKVRTSGARYQPEIVERSLKEVDDLFHEIEAQLRQMRMKHIAEHWLCGPEFTAADINLCIMLARLDLLGLLERYADRKEHPAMFEYWAKAAHRYSIKRHSMEALLKARQVIMKRIAENVTKRVVMGGLVLAGGIFIAQKFRN